ncbi:MAG: Uma2 family endonuclease [Verrucomicrobiaceae bacterium]|nr:Uma2 family endonuclease [Verrucomicrobiaceae bacterium]
MSALLKPDAWLSPKAYLECELRSEVRHEYLGGHVYAMAGASRAHNVIAGNIFAALRGHLRGKKCRAFINDMKVRVPVKGRDVFYYPDVVVTCQARESSEYFTESPTIIFEVISKETEAVDRREKLISYFSLPSMKVYVLVDQYQRSVEVIRRSGKDWRLENLKAANGKLHLPEIKFELAMPTIYEESGI